MTAAGSLDALDHDRRDVLDTSGWGRRFVFYQPRNLAFWAYVVLVGLGIVGFVPMLVDQPAAYSTAIAWAVVLFVAYGALLWWFTQRVDRYAKLPVKLLVTGLLWGAFAATWVMAAPANDALSDLYAKSFGQTWSLNWAAALSAPFTEELSKGVGLLLLVAMAPRVVRTAFDGLVLGVAIGLGFQINEDISYALHAAGAHFGADPVRSEMSTIFMRMGLGIAAHVLYSAVFCAGLIYVLGRPAAPRRVGRGLLLMATAMLLHGVWDGLGAITGGDALLVIGSWIVAIAIALGIAVLVYRATVGAERDVMRAVLAPEVARGVLDAAELDAVTGTYRARRRFRKHGKGRTGLVLDAIYDLAGEIAAARGADTARVRFARSEVARVREGTPSRW